MCTPIPPRRRPALALPTLGWVLLVALLPAACRSGPAAQPAGPSAAGPGASAAAPPVASPPAHTPSPTAPDAPPAAPATPSARRLIDAHSHLFGDGIWSSVQPVMDGQHISYFINLSGGTVRQGMAQGMTLAHDSDGRVLNAMNIDWNGFDEPAWGQIEADELSLCVTQYGYAALKVTKALGLFARDRDGNLIAVDDPRIFPLWERAGELGVPVFIHNGDPAAFWLPVTPANERYAELQAHPNWSFAGPGYPSRETLLAELEHLFQLFPQTTWISVHFGNNAEDPDYVERILDTYPNVYIDIAARIPEFGRHDAARMHDFFVRHADRILFGTDIAIGNGRHGPVLVLGSSGSEMATPDQIPEFYRRHFEYLETDHAHIAHPTPIQGDWTVDAINLPADVLERIYYQNAYDLIVAPWLARTGGVAPAPEAPPDASGRP